MNMHEHVMHQYIYQLVSVGRQIVAHFWKCETFGYRFMCLNNYFLVYGWKVSTVISSNIWDMEMHPLGILMVIMAIVTVTEMTIKKSKANTQNSDTEQHLICCLLCFSFLKHDNHFLRDLGHEDA